MRLGGLFLHLATSGTRIVVVPALLMGVRLFRLIILIVHIQFSTLSYRLGRILAEVLRLGIDSESATFLFEFYRPIRLVCQFNLLGNLL